MLAPEQKQRFELLLQPEIYEAAWRYASRLSATREDAEDLLQEGLIVAVNRIDSLRENESFRGWLMCIIRRRYIDHWRRARARPQAVAELPQLIAADAREEFSSEIADALNRLPEAQRELLVLFYVDGLNLNETGQVLGISARAVRQRLYRARLGLRKSLSRPASPDQRMQQVNSGMRD